MTDEDVVRALYETLLLRSPDPDGLRAKLEALAGRQNIGDVISAFLASSEFADQLPRFLRHYNLPVPVEMPLPTSAAAEHTFTKDWRDFLAIIEQHPGLRDQPCPDLDLSEPLVVRTETAEGREALRAKGISLRGGTLPNIVICDASTTVTTIIDLADTNGNIIVFTASCQLRGNIWISGNDNLCICQGRVGYIQDYGVWMYGNLNAFLFGRDSTSFGTRFYVEGPKHHLIVSEDCMFSQDVVVSGTDHHAILDCNGNVVNLPLDVVLEPHSWIGLGATILKGVRVGHGSIIGARSLVTRDVPSHTLVAGVPARVLRSDVTWSRESAFSLSRNS